MKIQFVHVEFHLAPQEFDDIGWSYFAFHRDINENSYLNIPWNVTIQKYKNITKKL